jgi:hypothetical protein
MEFIPRCQKSVLKCGQFTSSIAKPKAGKIEELETRVQCLESQIIDLYSKITPAESGPSSKMDSLESKIAPADVDPTESENSSKMDLLEPTELENNRSELLLLAASLGIKPIANTAKLAKLIRKAQNNN